MPLDINIVQTYQEAYANPMYDLEVMRIPTEQEVNNAIKAFLDQINVKKSDFD